MVRSGVWHTTCLGWNKKTGDVCNKKLKIPTNGNKVRCSCGAVYQYNLSPISPRGRKENSDQK